MSAATRLTETQRCVLDAIERGGRVSPRGLARMTGTKRGHAERTAESLYSKLLVERDPQGGFALYSINDAGREALMARDGYDR